MKLNLGCGPHKLEGFRNLDKEDGWMFEYGLEGVADGSVEAITVSHALMYVASKDWPFVFGEFARVLQSGGVIRITEDETGVRRSSRYGGFEDAVTLTSWPMLRHYLIGAGLEVHPVLPDETTFADNSLIQRWHGDPPKVLFIEGVKS